MKVVPLRQAAILLSALPKPELAAILKRLEPAHAASLAGQLTKLSRIESAELNVAIGRFLSSIKPQRRTPCPCIHHRNWLRHPSSGKPGPGYPSRPSRPNHRPSQYPLRPRPPDRTP